MNSLQAAAILRSAFQAGDDIRDAGLQTPNTIVRFDDIPYGPDPKTQSLDVYRPKDREGKLPVIVNVHGGGFVYGDKERYQYYGMELAEFGFAVVNFTYRLAPEHSFPAPFVDTGLVFDWVFTHAEEYGLDTDQIFAVGDSAGATILSLYAAMSVNPALKEQYGVTVPEDLRFRAIGLTCGSYQLDLEHGVTIPTPQGDVSTADLILAFLPEKGSRKELDLFDLKQWMNEEYPPTWILTASQDFLRSQSPYLQNLLLENNVSFEFCYFGGKEPLGHVFHLNIRTKPARQANESMIFFFQSQLD